MGLTRRQFLQWAGATSIGAVIFNGCNVPDEEIHVQSPLTLPEDLVTGRDNYYATVFQSNSGSEGLKIRVMEGRAKKVEGNPDYPLNVGKHGVRSEALLQELYHPDRIKGPMRSVSSRGPYRPISWDTGILELTNILEKADPSSVLIAVGPTRGILATILQRFADSYGARLMGFDPLDQTVLRHAMHNLTGKQTLPDFDLANTNLLLSFGADFLATWIDPTHFMRGYGEFRQGTNRKHRGHLIQIESRFSNTAANADEWIYLNPGTDGMLAGAIAYVVINEGLSKASAATIKKLTGGRGAKALNDFRPGNIADLTGVTSERIVNLARMFADTSNGPNLAIGGGLAGAQTNGADNLTAIYALNHLVDSINRPGGLVLNPDTLLSEIPAAPLSKWRDSLDAMKSGEIKVVLTRDANLLYGLPGNLDVSGALRSLETVVSFASFPDEITSTASLVLPGHTTLEEWGSDTPNPGPGYPTVALQQPVVVPFTNTMAFGDILLRTAKNLGLANGLNTPTMYDALKVEMQPLHSTGIGSVRRPTFEEFWNRILQRGGWWDTSNTVETIPVAPKFPSKTNPKFKGNARAYPYRLVPFESLSLGNGGLAHLPWLQATPDPITTVTWGTWVELNANTAKNLNVRQEDIVIVESTTGEVLEAPVYINPASAPGIVGIPFGQGHTQLSSYAANRGANVFNILEPVQDKDTGALAWGATRVRLTKTHKNKKIAKMEGIVPAYQLEDDKIVQVTRSS